MNGASNVPTCEYLYIHPNHHVGDYSPSFLNDIPSRPPTRNCPRHSMKTIEVCLSGRMVTGLVVPSSTHTKVSSSRSPPKQVSRQAYGDRKTTKDGRRAWSWREHLRFPFTSTTTIDAMLCCWGEEKSLKMGTWHLSIESLVSVGSFKKWITMDS